MATFATDFSEYTVGQNPTVDGPAEWAISGTAPTVAQPSIANDATHGNYVRFYPSETTGTWNTQLQWEAIGTASEVEVLALIRRDRTEWSGPIARADSVLGSSTHYWAAFPNDATSLRLMEYVNETDNAGTQYGTGTHGLASTVDVWMWIKFKVSAGHVLEATTWPDGGTDPGTTQVTYTDSGSPLAAGYVGLNVRWKVYLDCAYFAVGTGGDSAPAPGAPPATNEAAWTEDDDTMAAIGTVTPPFGGVVANVSVVFDRIEAGRVYFIVSGDVAAGADQYQAEARIRAGTV